MEMEAMTWKCYKCLNTLTQLKMRVKKLSIYAKEIIGHCKDHAVPLHIIKTLSNC